MADDVAGMAAASLTPVYHNHPGLAGGLDVATAGHPATDFPAVAGGANFAPTVLVNPECGVGGLELYLVGAGDGVFV